jgi:uncharacterized protein YoxC
MFGKDAGNVQLGCSSFIFIALIVLIFSGGGVQLIEVRIDALSNEVHVLQGQVEYLTDLTTELSKTVAQLREDLSDTPIEPESQ